MSATTESRPVRALKHALAALFLFAGAVLVSSTSAGNRFGGLGFGFLNLFIGVGLLRHWRVARWFALGACFLALVGAAVVPVALFLWRPFAGFDAVTWMNFGLSGVAIAFGLLGYKGLEYLRSDLTRRQYAASPQTAAALAADSSSAVIYSALAWLGLLAVAAAAGVGNPRALFANVLEVAARRPESASTGHDLPRSNPAAPDLPDLAITGLCLVGESLVAARIENRGGGTSSRKFKIAYDDLGLGRRDNTSEASVPPPGGTARVALDRAINQSEVDGVRLDVNIRIDSTNRIEESNENNNSAQIPIVFHYFYPGNLAGCDQSAEAQK